MRRKPFVYQFTKKIAFLIFSVFYQIKVYGSFPIPQGPLIILPKHQYWTDIPIISLIFKPLLYFVAKRELFRFPIFRNYLSFLGGIPIDRKQTLHTLNSFKYLLSLLKLGEKIVIFPEGTYYREGVGRGKSRLLQMILKFQEESNQKIPFLPVGVRYGKRKGLRREVEVHIGSLLFWDGESDALSLTHRIMEEIGRLSQMPRLHD
ncbi:MAG: lysophospholipid acyltransferase family protein [Thermodesulfobacteriota bacterium]